jgi:hypothetical protein
MFIVDSEAPIVISGVLPDFTSLVPKVDSISPDTLIASVGEMFSIHSMFVVERKAFSIEPEDDKLSGMTEVGGVTGYLVELTVGDRSTSEKGMIVVVTMVELVSIVSGLDEIYTAVEALLAGVGSKSVVEVVSVESSAGSVKSERV